MGKFWNRVKNTLGIVPRTAKTAARTIIDTTKATLNVVLDTFIGIGKTSSDIKKVIHESFTKGPWYHKLRKVPTSLALSPFMATEGVAETLRGTGVNACSSVRDIIGNTLTNEGKAIKMMGKSEKFQFSTEKLEYKNISPRNRLASLFGTQNELEVEKKSLKDGEKSLKDKEMKFEKEKETWRKNKKAEEDKNTQAIKELRDAFDKQKEEWTKRISLLEKEKKDLESALKNAKAEASEAKANVVKFTPNVENKEINTEGKTAPIIKIEPKTNEEGPTKSENLEHKKAA